MSPHTSLPFWTTWIICKGLGLPLFRHLKFHFLIHSNFWKAKEYSTRQNASKLHPKNSVGICYCTQSLLQNISHIDSGSLWRNRCLRKVLSNFQQDFKFLRCLWKINFWQLWLKLHSQRQESSGQPYLPVRQTLSYTVFSPVLPCATVLQLATGVSTPSSEEDGVSVPDTAPLTKYGCTWNMSWPMLMHTQAPVFSAKLSWKRPNAFSGVKAPSIMGWRIPRGCAETKTPRTPSPTTGRQSLSAKPLLLHRKRAFQWRIPEKSRKALWWDPYSTC